MSGYESLIWLNDRKGREYVCSLDKGKRDRKSHEELSDEEKAHCINVNEFVGTERW